MTLGPPALIFAGLAVFPTLLSIIGLPLLLAFVMSQTLHGKAVFG